MDLLGHERHRRAGHDVGDRRELLGSGLGRRDEARDRVGGGRQEEHPAVRVAEFVEPVLEAGHDADVAAAAADRPEQVGLVRGVDLAHLPSAVTTSAPTRLSIVRPCLRTR